MPREGTPVRGRKAAKLLGQNGIPFLFHLASQREQVAPTTVIREMGSDPKNAVALAQRLARAGFVEIEQTGTVAGVPIYGVRITGRGRRLLELIEPAIDLIEESPADTRARKKRQ